MTDIEARLAEVGERVMERRAREKDAHQLVLDRAGVSREDLETTRRTLMDLGRVKLDDLRVPPGFNLLADGSVGSINDEPPQWQRWATANQLTEECQHLGVILGRYA